MEKERGSALACIEGQKRCQTTGKPKRTNYPGHPTHRRSNKNSRQRGATVSKPRRRHLQPRRKSFSQKETRHEPTSLPQNSPKYAKSKKCSHTPHLAMQSVSMRLNTVSEMGDIVSVLSPAKNVINSIRSGMCDIMPEASARTWKHRKSSRRHSRHNCQTADIPVIQRQNRS